MKIEKTMLESAIDRNLSELNNGILKLAAHDELAKQRIRYSGMSFFTIAGHALYCDLISHTIRVLDEHREALSFWYVLRCKEAVVNRHAKAANLDLNELMTLSSKLKIVRDKTQFHIDRMSVQNPRSVWEKADIDGTSLSLALTGMTETLAHTKMELFGGAQYNITKYDASDIPKIVKAYESMHGSVHGV